MVWYDMHHFSSIEEVHSLKMLERLKSILGYAKTLGMKACMIVGANEAFSGTPENIKADWRAINGYKTEPVAHYHLEICPHRPGGMEELMAQHRKVLQAFSGVGVDYIVLWPYDQGGCTCEKCVPWGANGFLDIALEYRKVVEQELPGTQIICSTWGFDRFVDGEWEAFYQRMKEPAFQFFSHLLGYFVPGEKIPPFLLRGDVPGGKEMLSFSEISMQDAVPWGGFGANPRPSAMERDEREYGRYYKGNFPYSEGIFEDVNKVLTLGFASGRYDSAYSILLDYIRYEFCTPHPEAVAELMYDMEETLPRHRVTSDGRIADWCTKEISSDTEFHFVFTNPEKIDSVYRRALQINASLPKNLRTCWRWRILYLRAVIDYHLFHASGTATPQCEEFYEELIQLYHAQNADYCVSPPTREAMRQNRGQVVL